MSDKNTITRTLFEVPAAELHMLSGMQDERDPGRELTNLEAIQEIQSALSGGQVFVSSNGSLTPESALRNTEIARDNTLSPQEKAAQFMVAVRVTEPVKPE